MGVGRPAPIQPFGVQMILNKENMCSCGNIKSPNTLACRDCLLDIETDRAWWSEKYSDFPTSYNVCPECGGYKSRDSKMCFACYNNSDKKKDNSRKAARISADLKRGKNGWKLVCPMCGQPKMSRARLCRKCYDEMNKGKQWTRRGYND